MSLSLSLWPSCWKTSERVADGHVGGGAVSDNQNPLYAETHTTTTTRTPPAVTYGDDFEEMDADEVT